MRDRCLGSFLVLAIAGAWLAAPAVSGQSMPAGETRWDPPRTANGQPDIQGSWSQRSNITTYSIQAGAIDREEHTRLGGQATAFGRPIIDPKDGFIPYQPWAQERAKYLNAQHRGPSKPENLDPVSRCLQEGVPRIVYQGEVRILQFPDQIVMLHEYGHHYRVVYLDGRPHIGDGLKLWMGDSRGRWEENTLVVDVTNQNDKTWFDIVGSFHSDALRVTERWIFVDKDRIDYVATLDDPKVYTQPWKLYVELGRNEGEEHWENAPCEGNKAVHVAFDLPFEGQ